MIMLLDSLAQVTIQPRQLGPEKKYIMINDTTAMYCINVQHRINRPITGMTERANIN